VPLRALKTPEREGIPLEATGNEPVYGFGDYTYGFWTAVHLYFLKL